MSDAQKQPDESAPKRRRRKPKAAPVTERTQGSDSSSDTRRAASAPPATFADALLRDLKSPRFLAMAALVLACCFVYVKATLGAEAQPYVLVAIGVSAFALGSSSGIDPRHAVGVGGLVVAIGIALVGTSPSQAGAALCLAGGLSLAGGIHRLGRMGPEEPAEPAAER